MKHSTWLTSPDESTPHRAWRFDRALPEAGSRQPASAASASSGPRSTALDPETAARAPSLIVAARWHDAVRNRLRLILHALFGTNPGFEHALHQFSAAIATVDDPALVEAALFKLAHHMAPASWIELVAGESVPAEHVGELEPAGGETRPGEPAMKRANDRSGQAVLEVPLRCGGSIFGRLRIRSRTGRRPALRRQSIERLTTLCTMAASAMECLGGRAEWPRDDKAATPAAETTTQPPSRHDQTAPLATQSILIHDATFLNAVLPFALNQSRRHREPLSILCVAIDRKRSVQDLLGRAEVDRLVRHVGQITGSLIRTSDIVARLDDDRIVAVLPRAPRGGALLVAEKICRAVAGSRPADCAAPDLTVSIGVATFPSCCENVYSLFDAADEALACAQNSGRNQAVLAPPRPSTPSGQAHLAAAAQTS
jgi:diguanylate cyclase (GGDEF)-like protein